MATDSKNELEKRLFIAIDVPETIKDEIYNIAEDILPGSKNLKLVSAPNIHITLKFLGSVDVKKIRKIKNAIRETSVLFDKFKYEVSGRVNAFPSPENARVVFIEIDKGGDQMCEIYNGLENNLSRVNIKRDKRGFSPHITIARLKNRENIEKLVTNQKKYLKIKLDCSEIFLFESRLKPEGAEYIIIDRFSLK
jgi:RNA 2',3'-cyclic 3'-phosphodiesterase